MDEPRDPRLPLPGDTILVDGDTSVQFLHTPIRCVVVGVLPYTTTYEWVWLRVREIPPGRGTKPRPRDIYVQIGKWTLESRAAGAHAAAVTRRRTVALDGDRAAVRRTTRTRDKNTPDTPTPIRSAPRRTGYT